MKKIYSRCLKISSAAILLLAVLWAACTNEKQETKAKDNRIRIISL